MRLREIPRGWIFALKLLVSTSLVIWIVKDVDFNAVVEVLQQASIPILCLAFLLFLLGYILTAIRWRFLMSIHGVDPPLSVLVQSFMVGIFFNNLLPSTIGGDISRMYDVWRIVKDRVSAVSVILVDRFFGILALILWASLAVVVTPEIRTISVVVGPVLMILALALVVAAMIFGRPRRVALPLIERLRYFCARGPGYLEGPVGKFLNAFGPYYKHNRVLLKALGVSLILQANVIFHFWLVAWALHIEISIFAMCAIIPCALIIMLLPISVNAIGVREVTFVYFLGFFGVSNENAVVFAWIAFLFVIAQGLLGGVVFALRRSPPDLSQHPQTADRS